MMTFTLNTQTETLLREKANREGQDMDATADSILREVLEAEAQERAEAVAGVRLGLEDFAAGHYSTAAEAFAAIRVRRGILTPSKSPKSNA